MTELERRFSSHPPSAEEQIDMSEIRGACQWLAKLVETTGKPGRERAAAVTHIELAMFYAVASVARPVAVNPRDLAMRKAQ